jgi:hypothetical protein
VVREMKTPQAPPAEAESAPRNICAECSAAPWRGSGDESLQWGCPLGQSIRQPGKPVVRLT